MKEKEQTQTSKTQVYNLIILDKSGSMHSISNAAISGFNETISGIRIAQEKFKDTQEHFVSLMLFCDCDKSFVYENVPIEKVRDLTSREYRPCCSTPLYDAMGISLTALYNQIHDKENATAVVTVITDGLENASREYSGSAVKALVQKLTEEEGWQFAYMGTNQDVEEVSVSLSIQSSMSFVDNEEGMRRAWHSERNSKLRMFDELNDAYVLEARMSSEERKASRASRHRAFNFFMKQDEIADRITPEFITELADNEVIVFGSDIDGSHTGGLASVAVRNFGAVIGCGEGPQGKSYAIPTVGVSIEEMRVAVQRFFDYACQHPETKFLVTRIGCGHAGYSVPMVAEMFMYARKYPNVSLPQDFWSYIM